MEVKDIGCGNVYWIEIGDYRILTYLYRNIKLMKLIMQYKTHNRQRNRINRLPCEI